MALTAYWILHPASEWIDTPTGAQIAAGKLSNGSTDALASGSETGFSTTGTVTITEADAVTGLSASTAYKVAWTVYNGKSYATPVVGDVDTTGGITGAGELTIPAVTLSASGSLRIVGTAGLAIPATTLAGTGQVKIKGTAGLTISAVTLSGTGAVSGTVLGTAALTVPAATLAATGQIKVKGTAGLTVPAVELSASGDVTGANIGTAALTISAVELSASGQIKIKGAGDLTTPAVTLSARDAGSVTVTGTAAFEIPAVELSATGRLSIKGTAGLTAPAVTLSSGGNITHYVVGAVTLPSLTISGISSVGPTSRGAISLPSLTMSATVCVQADQLCAPWNSLRTEEGDSDLDFPYLAVNCAGGTCSGSSIDWLMVDDGWYEAADATDTWSGGGDCPSDTCSEDTWTNVVCPN